MNNAPCLPPAHGTHVREGRQNRLDYESSGAERHGQICPAYVLRRPRDKTVYFETVGKLPQGMIFAA